MNDKNFDQHLKSALENLEPDFDPTTWAMLERKMDAALIEEQPAAVDPVDKAVYHTLERLEAPYRQAHWNLLANRMQLQAIRLRRLRIAKIAEAAILLLLLWNTEAYWGTSGANTAPIAPKFDPNVPVAEAAPGNQPLRVYRLGGVTSGTAANTGNILAALQSQLTQPDAPNLLSDGYKTASSIPEILNDLNITAAQAQRRLYASTEQLPFGTPLSMFLIPSRNAIPSAVPTRNFSKKTPPFYLSTYLAANQNRVLINGARQVSGGYGATVAGGFRPNKWGVEAGIGYAHVRYTPKQEVKIYSGNAATGYYGSTVTEVSADLVTVPLKVTRRLARLGKTTAHAVAGVTGHVAAQKNYDYGTVFFSPNTLPPNFLPDPNQAPQLRQVGQGVFEKGSIGDNLYATVDAGVRLERPLCGGRHLAFVEPAYRQALGGKGIGQKQEPINSLSIQAGVLTYL